MTRTTTAGISRTLYRDTIAPLRRYLARLLGDDHEAQDVAHDAYLRVHPTISKQAAQKPEALLYTTARRLAFNRLRRRRIAPFTRDALEPETTASPAPGVVQQVMARQELQLLEEAIGQLPAGCRTVLLLRKVQEAGRETHRRLPEGGRRTVLTCKGIGDCLAALFTRIPRFKDGIGMILSPVHSDCRAGQQDRDDRLSGSSHRLEDASLGRGQLDIGAISSARKTLHMDRHLFAFDLRREAHHSNHQVSIFAALR